LCIYLNSPTAQQPNSPTAQQPNSPTAQQPNSPTAQQPNSPNIDTLLSKRIHSLRFLLIVFVVFIHNTVIDKGVNFAGGTQLFEVPFYVSKIKELVGTFTGIAVPLFFLISGFLLYTKEITFLENLKKKVGTILLPYTLWAFIVILFLFTAQSFSFTKPYFANLIVREFSPADWLGAFIGHFGKFKEPSPFPLVYQFWFLRDLFVLNFLFAIIRKIIDLLPAGSFFMFLMLWIGGIDIYIVNTGALFFFSLGYYIVKYNLNYKHIDNIKIIDMIIVYMITITASLFFNEKIKAIPAINIIAGILFFVKLSYNFATNDRIYKKLTWMEQYAFWVYATHGIVIAAMIKISVKIMPMDNGWLLVHYFLVTLLCILVLVFLGTIFKKIFPKLFSVLTGGR
jgi:surface polysaccharide O-acyltransferase-like enzyme